jgi:NAD-dependent DNA ligase
MPSNNKTLKKSKIDVSPDSASKKLKIKSAQREEVKKSSMSTSKRYNEEFIKVLAELSDLMIRKGEPYRAIAYQKAEQTIIKYPDDIIDPKQLKGLAGIGSTILSKLEEYVKTGTLAALEKERTNPANILAEIYGVGPKKAKELVVAGITSIAELRKHPELLNDKQKIGLEYLEDIQKRIPRAEIVEFAGLFDQIFKSVAPADSKFEIVGSYRRGAKNSGDIDIIITNKDNNKMAFDKVLDVLIKDKIITEVLSRGKTKSLTLVQIKKDGPVRRVDFLYSSPNEYAFALFYFTGSKLFNTVVRQRALDMGYTLNEHGLSHMVKGVKGKTVEHEFPTEESILNFLGLKYKNPEDRIDGRSVVLLTGSTGDGESKKEKTETPPIPEAQKSKSPKTMSSDIDDEDALLEALEKIKSRSKSKSKSPKTTSSDSDDEDALLEALEKIKSKSKSPKTTSSDSYDEDALLEALEKIKSKSKSKSSEVSSLEAEIVSEASDIQQSKSSKKNITLKKAKTTTVNELIQKFKTEGISALKMMTEDELSKIIRTANQTYYCDDKEILTDILYDIIREYTLEKYPKNVAANEGHTKCDVEMSKTKVKLPYELWSMDKIKPTTDALAKWLKTYKGPYVLSAKLDGISALYVAEDGKTPKLYTRGNGRYGQDISALIPHLIRKNVDSVAVRGEIIVTKEIFDKKYSKKFSNPRNFVAGVVNKKTVDASVLNDLDFVPYELIEPIMKPSEQFKFLDTLWTTPNTPETVAYEVKDIITNEFLSQTLLDWRKEYKYEIDGVIVTNDKVYPRPTKNPEYAFAFKMVISDQVAEAKVVDVLWAPSKDGYLKPRVQIEPITLGGAKIEFATGFNAKFIVDNKIGIGAIVSITRSGDVIPHIISVVVPAEKPLLPLVPYKWNDTNVDIIIDDISEDEIVREKNITAFFKNLEVDGLGPGNVKRLMAADYDTIPKILAMTIEDLLKVPGFKKKTAEKLYNGIHTKIAKASISELMTASNVFGRGFGDKRFIAILKMYPDILISKLSDKDKVIQLIKVDGVARKTAERFVERISEFVKFMEAASLQDKLMDESKSVEKIEDKDHVLYDKKIVFTGGKDKPLIEKLKEVGAEVSSSVSKHTFVVIAKTSDEDTGKADAARKLGIPIMTKEEFAEKYL